MERVKFSVVLLPLLLSAVCLQYTSARRIDECSEAGFFTHPSSCQYYYECRPLVRDMLYPVHARCPEDKAFDDAVSQCRPKNLVTSPPRCVLEPAVTEGSPVSTVHDGASDDAVVDSSTVDAVVNNSSVNTVVHDSSADADDSSTDTVIDDSSADVDDSSADTVVDDLSADAVADDSPADAVVDDSSADTVTDDSPADTVVDDLSADTVGGDLGVELPADSSSPPPPTEGNVTGNDTGAPQDFVPVGQDVNTTSDPLLHEEVIVSTTETVRVPDDNLCDHMSRVKSYFTLVISRPSLRESSGYQRQYNENVMKFNRDLEEAKNHVAIWDSGRSIVAGIKRIYQLASGYKLDFNRRLDINKRRIQEFSAQENDQELYDSLVSDIETLREEIKTTEDALPMATVPALRKYFEKIIATKRQAIARKQQEMKFTSLNGRTLSEYLTFLESVGPDGKEIEDLAKQGQEPIDNLHWNLASDSRDFKKYARRTAEGKSSLTEEQTIARENLEDNQNAQRKLENQKDSLDKKVDDLSDRNWDIVLERSRLLNEMEKKIDTFHQQAEELCTPSEIIKRYVPTLEDIEKLEFPQLTQLTEERSHTDKLQSLFESATQYMKSSSILRGISETCDQILEENDVALDLSEERETISQLSSESKRNHRKINGFLRQASGINPALRRLYDASTPLETRVREIDAELLSLQMHSADLKDLHEGADTSRESLPEIIRKLQELHDPFETINAKIDDMIVRGKAVESEDDISREKIAIERGIHDVKSQVDQLVLPNVACLRF